VQPTEGLERDIPTTDKMQDGRLMPKAFLKCEMRLPRDLCPEYAAQSLCYIPAGDEANSISFGEGLERPTLAGHFVPSLT
jgi:hypothetical protein